MVRFIILLSSLLSLTAFADETLFTYEGRAYNRSNVAQAAQQQIFELDKQHYDGLNQIISSIVVRQYIEDKAKKEKKTEAAVEQELFVVKIGESEAKKWFEGNKERLGGRSFESIKGEIINFLAAQERENQAKQLIAKLQKDKKLSFAITEPKARPVKVATDGFPSLGNPKSKVKIIEFADYRCGHCKHASEVMKKVVEKYKDKVEFFYLDFPLQASGISTIVSGGGVCADMQKKFWSYHDKAFDRQAMLNEQSPKDIAKELKLDMVAFEKCMNDPATIAKVNRSRLEGQNAGVSGTPAIYINGIRYSEGLDEGSIAAAIDAHL